MGASKDDFSRLEVAVAVGGVTKLQDCLEEAVLV